MRLQQPWWSGLVAVVLLGLMRMTAMAVGGTQFLPILSVREGAPRSVQIPIANGIIDYVTLLNERDGGIHDVPRDVAYYERLKGQGPTGAATFPMANALLVSALAERATADRIPLLSLGGARGDAAAGRIFPYVFTAPSTWWSQNTAKIRFIGQRAGGMDRLKGRKIVHVYLDTDYGRDTLALLDTQAAHYGFVVQHLAVAMPGLDQKATWLRVKVAQPDWVLLRTAGISTTTALREAAQAGLPRAQIVGPAPTCSEQDMLPAGEAAIGFICANYHGTGTHFPLIQEIVKYVYARGKGAGPASDVGTAPWMRGMLGGLLTAEALRTAMRYFGNQPMTGAQVQWGFEHLTLTAVSIKELGAEGLVSPMSLSCRDHEGGGGVQFQQWDGTQWRVISDWIAPDQALVRPLVGAAAARYAQDKGITPRDCP